MKIALSGLEKLFKIKRTHADHRKKCTKGRAEHRICAHGIKIPVIFCKHHCTNDNNQNSDELFSYLRQSRRNHVKGSLIISSRNGQHRHEQKHPGNAFD